MAQAVDGQPGHIAQEIVYDSQEEQDQWPKSQQSNPEAEEPRNGEKASSRTPNVYGRQQKV